MVGAAEERQALQNSGRHCRTEAGTAKGGRHCRREAGTAEGRQAEAPKHSGESLHRTKLF